MTERSFSGEFDALERDLTHLAADLVFPPTPSFTIPVSPEAVAPSRRVHEALHLTWWRAVAVAAVVLVITTLAIPDARDTVAGWFGFPGIRIEFGDRDDDPSPTVTSVGGSLLLGQPATLDAAQAQVALPLRVPVVELLGNDPEVYVNTIQDASVVSLLYPASADLPAIGTTGVGLLLMQIDASGNTSMMIVKRATGETAPRPVTINDEPGLWIQGGVLMADAGDPFWTYQRRSGNVLIWEQGGITYRMESNLFLAEAVAIAESLEPVGD